MASISTDKNGLRRILFFNGNGERKKIHLGNVPMKLAKEIKSRVEALTVAKAQAHSIDLETATWLGKIADELHAKLAAAGLVPERVAQQSADLKSYFTTYIVGRPDVRANSKRNMLQAVRYLSEFFGDGRDVRTVTHTDAERFAAQMRADFAEATAVRTIKFAKQFFKVAVREGVTEQNPFREVKAGTAMSNPARMYFVTGEQTQRLLDACPDGTWRLIVALARYGGLRTPSEHLALTWADMDWERNRFLVRSTKTGARWVPLFPELRPHLEETFDRAEAGTVHVITRTRSAEANWRTTFMKIVARAGLTIWEKPFQNMRASRETELAADYPLHVVTAWIGNSVPVAAKHYLQVTDADFNRAATGGAKSGAPTAQNRAQTGSAAKCRDMSEESEVLEEGELRQFETFRSKSLQDKGIHPIGFEPITFGSVDLSPYLYGYFPKHTRIAETLCFPSIPTVSTLANLYGHFPQ